MDLTIMCLVTFKIIQKSNCSLCESESEVAQPCRTLCNPWTVAHQALPSMGFSRQEYWSGLPFPPPEDLQEPSNLNLKSKSLKLNNFN